jgi:hypothetical protein
LNDDEAMPAMKKWFSQYNAEFHHDSLLNVPEDPRKCVQERGHKM